MYRTVRAKMRVQSIDNGQVRLSCQYDDTIPEDQRFTKATPWGDATLAIDNPSALEFFKIGGTYYLDFKEAP